mgnify:CR=1 FL=1
MAKVQYMGTGRRKKSVARVYLVPGTGKITINKSFFILFIVSAYPFLNNNIFHSLMLYSILFLV